MRLNVTELYQRLTGLAGAGRENFGRALLIVLLVIGVLFLVIEALALVAGLALARSITGSVHALFVGTERVRRGDFTHKIDVQARRSAGRAGRVVQLDDRQHRGPAARAGGEEAARGRAADRARDPDVAAAAGAARHAGAVGDGALRAGARGRRRLLRLPAARRASGRRADRRRVGQGHVGGALHGGAEGADPVAEPHPHVAARPADHGQPDHRRSTSTPAASSP